MKYDWHVDNFLGFSLFRGLIFWFVLQLIWWLYDQHKSSYLPKYVQPCVKGLVPDHENCEYGIINNCIFGVFMNTLMSFCATSTRSTVEHFYSNLVSSSSDNPKRLWHLVNPLHPYLPLLQVSLSPTALLPSSQTKYPTFVCLALVTLLHHLHIYHLLLQQKKFDSDPIPTSLLKECAATLVPTISVNH